MNNDGGKRCAVSAVVGVASSVLAGVAVTLVLMFFGAGVVCFTGVSSNLTEIFVFAATIAGIFISGVLSARKAGGHGWLWGGTAGIIYAAVLFLAAIVHGNSDWLRLGVSATASFVCGSVGGIFGINLTHS